LDRPNPDRRPREPAAKQDQAMTVHQTFEAPEHRHGGYSFAPELVTLSEPLGQGAEYIRALRTHVMAQHVEAGRRALAVCEPAPKLGATFVAANLAVALAQAGVSTLLIDGNLRSPAMHHLFRSERSAPGSGSTCAARTWPPTTACRTSCRTCR